jgi:hypothetical protein
MYDPKTALMPRLTFNVPAIRQFFSTEVSGVKIRIDGNSIFLKPSWYVNNNDCLELVTRGTKGKQIIIAGSMAGDIMEALTEGKDIERFPFFVLKPAKQQWLRLEQHTSDDPPRLDPHVRLWLSKAPYTGVSPATVSAGNMTSMIDDLAHTLRRYQSIVETFEKERRIGHPPRHVQTAKKVLSNFESMYRDGDFFRTGELSAPAKPENRSHGDMTSVLRKACKTNTDASMVA